MSDMHTLQLSCQSCSGTKGFVGHESMCLEYKEDNGDLKHGDILPIEMT